MARFFGKILNRTENILLYSACLSLFIMMCLVTADAGGRYLLNRPITGADEFTEKYLMVATVFLGVCYAYRGGAFIRVTFLVDRLPLQVRIALNYVVQLVSILLGIIFFLSTVKRAVLTFVDGISLVTIPLPLGPAYVLVPLGYFLLFLLLIVDISRIRTRKPDLFKGDESDTSAV